MNFLARHRLALTLLACSGLAAAQAGGEDPSPRDHRVEHFELRASADGPALGFATLLRTDAGDEAQLEWQIHFLADEIDVWQVETLSPSRARCIWREQEHRHARSVIAERHGAELELLEWGRPSAWRGVLSSPAACSFPLELAERLRDGETFQDPVPLFDPLSNGIELARAEVRETEAGDGRCLREIDLVRADGTLAAGWTFLDRELTGFRWQRGGLVAVRVDEARLSPRLLRTSVEGRAPADPPAAR